jgi:hypothetical protein
MQTHSSSHQRPTATSSIGVSFDPAAIQQFLLTQQNPQGLFVPGPLLSSASQAPPLLGMAQQPFIMPRGPLPFSFPLAALNAQQQQLFMMSGGQMLVPQPTVQIPAQVGLNPAGPSFIPAPRPPLQPLSQFHPAAPGVSQVRHRQPIPENEQQKIREQLRGQTLPKQTSASATSEALGGDGTVAPADALGDDTLPAEAATSAPNGNVGSVADAARSDATVTPSPSILQPVPLHLRSKLDVLASARAPLGAPHPPGSNVRAPLFVPPAANASGIQFVPIGQSSAPSALPSKDRPKKSIIAITNPDTGQSLDLNRIRKETEDKKRTATAATISASGHEPEQSKYSGVIEIKNPNELLASSVPSESSTAQHVPSETSSVAPPLDNSDPTIGTLAGPVALKPATETLSIKASAESVAAVPSFGIKFGDFTIDSASPTPPPDATPRSDKSPEELTIGTIQIDNRESSPEAEAEKPAASEPLERRIYSSGELRDLFSLRLNLSDFNPSITTVPPEIMQQVFLSFQSPSLA